MVDSDDSDNERVIDAINRKALKRKRAYADGSINERRSLRVIHDDDNYSGITVRDLDTAFIRCK